MKPLHELTAGEKAQLLHELFPQEIPKLVDFIHNMCEVFIEYVTDDVPCNITGLGSADTMRVALAMVQTIVTDADTILTEAAAFADLFTRENARIGLYCIRNYVATQLHKNRKFSIMVNLLFND